MPRIDSYPNLDNTTVATDDEFVVWDTSGSQVANLPLSALDARFARTYYTDQHSPTLGVTTSLRSSADNDLGMTSGRLCLDFFTADKSFTASKVRARSRGTAAATITLIRFGIYTVDGAGDGTLVASTTNDTSLFIATFTQYTKNLTATYDFVAGQRYAAGWLVVATTAPVCYSPLPIQVNPGQPPRLYGDLSGLSDLPATFTDASLGTNTPASPFTFILTAGAV
jgi:hypothetical protein